MANEIIPEFLHIVFRAPAKLAGLRYYFTGKPCHLGHLAERQTSTGQCRTCKRVWSDLPQHKEKKDRRSAEYRQENRELLQSKSAAHYRLNREAKLAYGKSYRDANRELFTRLMAEWRSANRERSRLNARIAQSKRRAKEQSGAVSFEVRGWLERQKKICHWCTVSCEKNFHIDHYQPLSKGGKHEVSNLVISCQTCNLSKSAKDPYDFAKLVGRLF